MRNTVSRKFSERPDDSGQVPADDLIPLQWRALREARTPQMRVFRPRFAVTNNAAMGLSLYIRRVAARIACFAILFAALAPTVSHLLAASADRYAFLADICSVSGQALIPDAGFAARRLPLPAKKEVQFEHCPFCLTHAGSFGLPPRPGFTLPAAGGTSVFPSLFYRSPRPLFVWATPQSRAPPARS